MKAELKNKICPNTLDGRHLWKGKLFENWTKEKGHLLKCKACNLYGYQYDLKKLTQ